MKKKKIKRPKIKKENETIEGKKIKKKKNEQKRKKISYSNAQIFGSNNLIQISSIYGIAYFLIGIIFSKISGLGKVAKMDARENYFYLTHGFFYFFIRNF